MEILLVLGFLVFGGFFVLPALLAFSRLGARLAFLETDRRHMQQAFASLFARVTALETAPARAAFYRPAAADHDAAERPAVLQSAALAWQPLSPAGSLPGAGAPVRAEPASFVAPPPPVAAAEPEALRQAARIEEGDVTGREPLAAPRIDWEQWVGVRGAAALGAGILVIALLFFVRYSVDQGWLTPTLRVAFGGVFSVAAVGVAQARLRQRYEVLAAWLSGAGVAGLFASVWAAHRVVPLLGAGAAFACFVLLALGCLALALRTSSMPIALLGAAGGFATPLAVSANLDRPVGVLAYVLVLDAALLVLAFKKRWWQLSGLALCASAAYETAWISSAGAASVVPMHIAILVVLAGLFGAVPAFAVTEEAEAAGSPARLLRLAALLLPFAFALKLVENPAVVAQPAPIGVLLVAVTLLGCGLARLRRESAPLLLVALGDALVVADWARHAVLAEHVVVLSALGLALSAPFVALAWLERDRPTEVREHVGIAGGLVLTGSVVIVAIAALAGREAILIPASLIGLLSVGGVVLARFADAPKLAGFSLAGAVVALGFVGTVRSFTQSSAPVGLSALAASIALIALAAAAVRHFQRTDPETPAFASWNASLGWGARTAPIIAFLALAALADRVACEPYMVLASVLAGLMLAGAGNQPSAHATLAPVLLAALAVFAWRSVGTPSMTLALFAFAISTAAVAATFWPRFGLRGHPSAPFANAALLALAPFALAPRFADASRNDVGALAGAVAVAAVCALVATHRLVLVVREEAQRWFGALAVVATTSAMVALLSNEQLTWGLAAFGVGLVALGRKRSLAAPIFAGLAHLLAATVRLALNPWVLVYHPRGSLPLVNWITPTFLLPAAACALAWWVLQRTARADDDDVRDPLVPRFAAALALIIGFAWVNVAVLDLYAEGAWLSLAAGGSEAQKLSISVAWGGYGVALLVLGLTQKSVPLRWTSLALIVATAGKVFVYDLGNLRDLYRVASLAGLAISLLGISVLYQRFVFGPLARHKPD